MRDGLLAGLTVHDALQDPRAAQLLLERLRRPGTAGPLHFEGDPAQEVPSGLVPRLLNAEQSNSSLVYGDEYILKVFRRIQPGVNPDLEVPGALARQGCHRVPAPVAWMRTTHPFKATLGVLQPYLRNAADGWTLALDALASGDDFTAQAHALGRATADVHLALSSAFPVGAPGENGRTAAAMTERLTAAAHAVPALQPYVPGLRSAFAALATCDAGPPAQRIHGDLHLGQVLRAGREWFVIDFEGEPSRPLSERRSAHSPCGTSPGCCAPSTMPPGSAALAPGVGAALPRGLLRGLRGPCRLGPAQEARAAPRLRDGPGRVRGAVRGPAPTRLAARTHGGDRAPRRERRLKPWPCTKRRCPDGSDGSAPSAATDGAAAPALDPHDRGRLLAGAHHDPHALLGAHPVPGGIAFRALRPFAREVSVVVDGARTPLVSEGDGLFSAVLPLDGIPAYTLAVAYGDDEPVETDDPYRFLPALGDFDLHLIREGRHEELWTALGAHPMTHQGVAGTRFTVWAPNALGVRLAADFTYWDGTAFPMRSLGSSGVWELFLPGVGEGTRYKFEIHSRHGHRFLKADPMARRTEAPPNTASVVTASHHEWGDAEWMARRGDTPVHEAPFSVYEVHLPSWRPGLTYRELAEVLPAYVTDMGFTHVELMPVAEHPYGPSWGIRSPASTRRPRGSAPRTTSSTWSTPCTGPGSA